jgi:glycosyltransferase involved in cell wall biosynthesis
MVPVSDGDEGAVSAAPSSRVRDLDEAEVLLVARRWRLRGRHTSVERSLDWFPDSPRLTTDDLRQRPDRLLHLVASAARQEGYTIWGVELEARAVGRSLRRRTRPRVVHFLYGDHDFHWSGRALRLLGVKVVVTLWFSVEELGRRMPHKRHLRHVDLVLATGQDQLEQLASVVDRDRLALLPLGVDTAFFAPGSPDEVVPGRLLQVGQNRRDLETLRAAVARLPGVTLQVVGCHPDLVAAAGFVDADVRPQLSDEELRDSYRQADVVVLPLLEGGSSNALNEALSCGVPVVATALPNMAAYVGHAGVTLVPPGDPRAFAAACRALLDDPDRRRAAAEAARAHALAFDWSVVREELLDHYEALLAR